MKGWRHPRQPRGTKYCSAFSDSCKPRGGAGVAGSLAWQGAHLPGMGAVLWEHMLPAREGVLLLLPWSSPAHGLSIPFVLSDLISTLFFFSWSFLRLDAPFSLTHLSAPRVLRG